MYPLIAPLMYIVIRAVSILIPPIPGLAIDLIGMAFFGWLLGFIYAEIGILLGTTAAFLIGRKFREPLLKKFISLQKIDQYREKLSSREEFWSLVLIREITTPVFDYMSYVAGLSRISLWRFFLISLVATVPHMFLFFYLGNVFLEKGIYYLVLFILIILVAMYFLKKKYFKN